MREVLEQLSRYLKSVDEEVKVISKQIQSLECVGTFSKAPYGRTDREYLVGAGVCRTSGEP